MGKPTPDQLREPPIEESEYSWVVHVAAFVVIGCLIFVSYAFADWVFHGTALFVISLCIAATNASLMILFLMNLGRARSSNQVFLMVASFLVVLFFSIAVLDVVTRQTSTPAVQVPAPVLLKP